METIENRAKRLVEQNVQACMSGIVYTLANCGHDLTSLVDPSARGSVQRGQETFGGLVDQAFELASPIPDYEEAARQEGWKQDAPNAGDIEPYDREVFEHWAVSSYLAELLQAVGEKVDTDFGGLNVWARTTTGQMICMDSCIEACVREQERRYQEAIASLPPLPANAAPAVLY